MFPNASGFFWWGPDSECSDAEDEFDAAERFDGSGLGGQVRGRGLGPAAAAALGDTMGQGPGDPGSGGDDEGEPPKEKKGGGARPPEGFQPQRPPPGRH